jgi:hypothetical protein
MSHLSKIEIQINDLQALKQACQAMGLEFMENQKSFVSYQGSSPCTHAIKVPEARYEIGVMQTGKTYELQCDFWSVGGLQRVLGENGNLIKKHYSLERVKNEAKKKRYRIQEQPIQNGARLILTTT